MSVSPESIKQPFWSMVPEETMRELGTRGKGLSDAEAAARRVVFGANEIAGEEKLTPVLIFFEQFRNPLIMILVFAGAITVLLSEWVDAVVIFAAVLVNVLLGFWQEYKAETVLAKLKTYIRTRVRVRRGGEEREMDASELVPGDIMKISQGDRIAADGRIVSANNFETDEAVLTGESLPETKGSDAVGASTALADRTSMVYGGTLAVRGFAEVAATATGQSTEFGRIASLVQKGERTPTPLQRSISDFARRASIILGILVAALFLMGLGSGYPLLEIFFIAVAVAVQAVPEGLPVALTVILAVGVERLARRNGVVRRLLAAETLGATSVILTDKTGTLTQAKMELAEIVPWRARDPRAAETLIRKALANTDVAIQNRNDAPGSWLVAGHPLEVALVTAAAKMGIRYDEAMREIEVLDRLPFSSEYKFSGSVAFFDSRARLSLLGAPDVILQFTATEERERGEILDLITERASRGERVLGVASKELPSKNYRFSRERAFKELEFDGLVSFRDPLRPSVKHSIARIAEAGVKTVIVTGDHRATAEAVARETGVLRGGTALTGDDLKYLSKEELVNRADEVRVFARVTPEDKLYLVKTYKEKGEVVAVTGDGVNDAPALKEADIGVAVGSGTDVAKGAADLVLLDDNFDTLVAAIEEGRRIIQNIRKVLTYLLSNVFDGLVLIGGSLLAGVPLPLGALQILFVNFFTDSFPAVAFAFETGVDDHFSRGNGREREIFSRAVKFFILAIGTTTSILLFFLYLGLLKYGFEEQLVRSFIFASFATYSLLLALALRSLERPVFSYNPFSNFYLTLGVFIGVLLTALAIYLPFFQRVFDTVPLPPFWAFAVFAVGIVNIAAVEAGKWIFRRHIL